MAVAARCPAQGARRASDSTRCSGRKCSTLLAAMAWRNSGSSVLSTSSWVPSMLTLRCELRWPCCQSAQPYCVSSWLAVIGVWRSTGSSFSAIQRIWLARESRSPSSDSGWMLSQYWFSKASSKVRQGAMAAKPSMCSRASNSQATQARSLLCTHRTWAAMRLTACQSARFSSCSQPPIGRLASSARRECWMALYSRVPRIGLPAGSSLAMGASNCSTDSPSDASK